MTVLRTFPGEQLVDRLWLRRAERPRIGVSPAFFARFGLEDPWALSQHPGDGSGWLSWLGGRGRLGLGTLGAFQRLMRRRLLAHMGAGLLHRSALGLELSPELASWWRFAGEPDALREIVAICNELGLVSVLTYIFGLPGDTNDSIRRTLDFVNEVKPTVVDFHPLLYLPGSEIADTMEQDRYSRLGNGEINQWCLRAYFEYYVKHGGGMRVLSYLLRHNPGWFTNMLPMGRHAMEYFGLFLFDRKGTKRFL